MMTDGDGQSEALRIKRACRAEMSTTPSSFAIGRIVNRNSGTGPSLYLRAKMLRAVDLDRFRFRYCRTDRVGAKSASLQASSVFQMNSATGINDPVIALGIDDPIRWDR